MSVPPVPGWSPHAQAVAHFEALLRAPRAGDVQAADLAQRELRALALNVAPIPPGSAR